jgi:hypothetical protein
MAAWDGREPPAGARLRAGGRADAAEVPAGDQTGAERAEGIAALDPQHRPGVGVTEVMQAEVVGDGVTGDIAGRIRGIDVAAGPPDHDGDLALIVEPLAAAWPHNRAPV